MSRPSRETVLAIALLSLLLLVAILAAVVQSREETSLPALASFSNGPTGARAVRLWLEEEGYAIHEAGSAAFSVPDDTRLALMLEPQTPGLTAEEWAVLEEWVAAGGILALLGEGFGAAFSFSHFDVEIDYAVPVGDLAFTAPFLGSPPFSLAQIRPRAALDTARDDIVTLVAAGERPLLIAFPHGDGLVILGTITYPLTNAGLKEGDNALFALNLATLAGESGAIWFDEWHHGVRGQDALSGPGQWLRQTPAGQALLYSAAVLFLGVLLAGRRFGRPIPLARPGQRRAPLEHIVAVANLSRRAGHRHAVLAQVHLQLKRELGRRFRINPTLPDDEYASQLAGVRPDLDTDELRSLLARLRNPDTGEAEMVALVRAAAAWLDR
ncbi:MAG: DUF4350 domain-containing protein [Anaerolineae bacterium]|nr:DUF4350 domain-containing protein [Anaerolineae bacterium]